MSGKPGSVHGQVCLNRRADRLFLEMAGDVSTRTRGVKRRVYDPHIEIDAVRRMQNITEVVGSDFFRDLQSRARVLGTQRGVAGPDGLTLAIKSGTLGEE